MLQVVQTEVMVVEQQLLDQGWAQGSFVEAKEEVEAD